MKIAPLFLLQMQGLGNYKPQTTNHQQFCSTLLCGISPAKCGMQCNSYSPRCVAANRCDATTAAITTAAGSPKIKTPPCGGVLLLYAVVVRNLFYQLPFSLRLFAWG
ncbi:MAG: hypothetical protein EAZ16_07840 [Sphingobacteriales bacterium]|nr:MAG: hypothetical protein EAZ16_07840 [Sphingobacteriales bacterium]